MEEEQRRIETTRIETLKTHERSAAVDRYAKARLESARHLPQKQISLEHRRIHRALWAELRTQQDQHQKAEFRQTQQREEQIKSMYHQTCKQQLVDHELLTQQ